MKFFCKFRTFLIIERGKLTFVTFCACFIYNKTCRQVNNRREFPPVKIAFQTNLGSRPSYMIFSSTQTFPQFGMGTIHFSFTRSSTARDCSLISDKLSVQMIRMSLTPRFFSLFNTDSQYLHFHWRHMDRKHFFRPIVLIPQITDITRLLIILLASTGCVATA